GSAESAYYNPCGPGTNYKTDSHNCGKCGNQCPVGRYCNNSVCVDQVYGNFCRNDYDCPIVQGGFQEKCIFGSCDHKIVGMCVDRTDCGQPGTGSICTCARIPYVDCRPNNAFPNEEACCPEHWGHDDQNHYCLLPP